MKEMGTDLYIMLGLLSYPLCEKVICMEKSQGKIDAGPKENIASLWLITSLFKVIQKPYNVGQIHI